MPEVDFSQPNYSNYPIQLPHHVINHLQLLGSNDCSELLVHSPTVSTFIRILITSFSLDLNIQPLELTLLEDILDLLLPLFLAPLLIGRTIIPELPDSQGHFKTKIQKVINNEILQYFFEFVCITFTITIQTILALCCLESTLTNQFYTLFNFFRHILKVFCFSLLASVKEFQHLLTCILMVLQKKGLIWWQTAGVELHVNPPHQALIPFLPLLLVIHQVVVLQ